MAFIQLIDVGLIVMFLLEDNDSDIYLMPLKWLFVTYFITFQVNLDNCRALLLLMDVIFSRIHRYSGSDAQSSVKQLSSQPVSDVYESENSIEWANDVKISTPCTAKLY
jgi:hypothetical protein